jgi:hypothetical protein
MVIETERKNNQEQQPLTIPVAILTQNGRVFVFREKSPEKYTSNEWRTLTGRPWRGEEEAKDLVIPAQECGFRIAVAREVGQISGDNHQAFSANRPVTFNFYICEVISGSFDPEIIHPDRDSFYNQFSRCEGKWFKIEELVKEKYLHPLVEQALKFLQKR